ncbi:hypothetical protein RB594_000979 [Gaeumannomyces avenae]
MLAMIFTQLLALSVAAAAMPAPLGRPAAGSSVDNIAALEARFPKLASGGAAAAAAHNSLAGRYAGRRSLPIMVPEPSQKINIRRSAEEEAEIARRGYAGRPMPKRASPLPPRNK